MPCSAARSEANRRNAQCSTGPRTDEGKERSRRNALKHGLTGDGIVVPDEDAGAIQERFDNLEGELRPGSEMARILVQRIALLSVRMERSARQEAAAIGEKMRAARVDFDEVRAAEVDRLMDRLVAEPASVARRLSRTPDGLDRMVACWGDLKYDLVRDDGVFWSFDHQQRAENLMGRYVYDYRISRVRALCEAMGGNLCLLGHDDGAGLAPADRRLWAREEMGRLIDAEVERLRGLREAIDHEVIEQDRAGAPARALFDDSPRAILARKYEAAAERGFHRAVRDLRGLDDQSPTFVDVPPAGDPQPPTPPEESGPGRGSMASFFPASSGPAAGVEGAAPPAGRPATAGPIDRPGLVEEGSIPPRSGGSRGILPRVE